MAKPDSRCRLGGRDELLRAIGVVPPSIGASRGLLAVRRRLEDGRWLFLAWQGTEPLDAMYQFTADEAAAEIWDPWTGERGSVPLREVGAGRRALRLWLDPGHSVLVRLRVGPADPSVEPWHWYRLDGPVMDVAGEWAVDFIAGGPTRPVSFRTNQLVSWAHRGDAEAERFAGTAVYRTTMNVQALEEWCRASSKPWSEAVWALDLGDVRHVARVRVNGTDLGVRVQRPYRWLIPSRIWRPGENQLEIEVTNLAANRIRDLDRRGVSWKIFYDINFVNVQYRPFDASGWPVQPSGLLGPVKIYSTRSVR